MLPIPFQKQKFVELLKNHQSENLYHLPTTVTCPKTRSPVKPPEKKEEESINKFFHKIYPTILCKSQESVRHYITWKKKTHIHIHISARLHIYNVSCVPIRI